MPRKKNGRLDRRFTDAFYLSFQDILQSIFKIHAEQKFQGKVDVVIDGKKGSGPTSRSISVYESVKEQLKNENHPYYPIMGTVIPGDDRDIKPLQAADFLAGQVRIAKTFNYKTPAFRMMYTEKRIFYNEMTADYLKRLYVDRANGRLDESMQSLKS